jgi:hypothetical protein
MKKIIIALIVLNFSFSAQAQQSKVKSPFVDKGVVALEINSEVLTDEDILLPDEAQNFETELKYGISDKFGLGAVFVADDNDANGFEYRTTGLQATYQFGEQNSDSPVASAVRLDYDYSHGGQDSDEIGLMFLFGHEGEKFSYGINVGANTELGTDSDDDIKGDLRASMSYLYRPKFQPGLEYFSEIDELDEISSISDASSRLGPVIRGDLIDGLSYEVGYLFGLSDKAPDGTYKLNFEYKMPLNPAPAGN